MSMEGGGREMGVGRRGGMEEGGGGGGRKGGAWDGVGVRV